MSNMGETNLLGGLRHVLDNVQLVQREWWTEQRLIERYASLQAAMNPSLHAGHHQQTSATCARLTPGKRLGANGTEFAMHLLEPQG